MKVTLKNQNKNIISEIRKFLILNINVHMSAGVEIEQWFRDTCLPLGFLIVQLRQNASLGKISFCMRSISMGPFFKNPKFWSQKSVLKNTNILTRILHRTCCFLPIFNFLSKACFFLLITVLSCVLKKPHYFIRILWQICYDLVLKIFQTQSHIACNWQVNGKKTNDLGGWFSFHIWDRDMAENDSRNSI